MLTRIIHFSIHNKLVVGLGTLIMVIAGIYSFTLLPIDAIPDITNNQVQVLTVCPTLATQEVEQFVTAPIEVAVKSIPGVLELRSISRFGLSVVTVVFKEDIDVYRARQMMNEKLKMAEQNIPPGFGIPELAPISTGLGEILHYRIEPTPGYEKKYSASDLREIQDWIVKKQLIGVPGVVEINSFGGDLKQYEVAVRPERLRSFQIGLPEILEALEGANENTGGAYVEKHSSVFFIRAQGLVKSLADIEQIVIKNVNGQPLRIGDVAKVRFGKALRYGAVSHNGEGEIVLGIVMMLKGENAAKVIERVKIRLEEIKKGLPEGITITTFLDRENLVNRTIATVKKNLIEGALIVIFVLVLLVGNFRAGLIIASVIPLAMLFALSMMQLFGVSANLMSLGALDFGLIVDGAVIIVEATLHYLHTRYLNQPEIAIQPNATVILSKEDMEESVLEAASRIMRSSVFGVIIILIVYLPILSLVGVEGKMFKPMAQTVSFALVGALLLSLTYVPAVSALTLNRKMRHHRNFADRIIHTIQLIYLPVLNWALHWRKTVIGLSLGLLVGSLLLFSRMGGEFIPTLDEGDIMMHGFLRPGTSLPQTLESHRMAQQIILDNFPNEVEQVISKIGSAEIPTDPMAIETADNIILLKPSEGWTKAETKEELVRKIEEKVHEIPGMAFEFTQPIKMRFDEMMTGVRSDIAVKIFGDNMDTLAHAGSKVEKLIHSIPGLADLKVEQVEGLPQIVINYHYDKIARYGLHIRDINATLRAAFAGTSAGVVYEDARRFDLVLRLDDQDRGDLEDVQQLPIATPNGELIPLSEVAEVGYRLGAAQISRDNAQRRIVVGANVRGRDVESAFKAVQEKLETSLKLPPGYFVTYGGQFENLNAAKARLSIAVPLALALIFLLLYFTFNSIKESLLIFSAIPMSAIGGIFALQIRSMPFSISAGVGFIALFGVAVLNGIVLITYFNQLEKEGIESVYERIRAGAIARLRPVLMTAAVASLGFLPMAISHGSGAEVQRPLATVVIGGLITSTLLTLVVLPVLYALFFGRKRSIKVPPAALMLLLPLLFFGNQTFGQNALREDDAIVLALRNHPGVRSASLSVQQQTVLRGTAKMYDPANIFHNVVADPVLGVFGTTTVGINQNFPTRKTTQANRSFYQQKESHAQAVLAHTEKDLIRQVREIYQHLGYLDLKARLYTALDSVYTNFATIAQQRYQLGDAALAEKLAAQDRAAQVRLVLETISHELNFDQVVLGQLLGLPQAVSAIAEPLRKQTFSLADTALIVKAPSALTGLTQVSVAKSQQEIAKAGFAPSFSSGVYGQLVANGRFFPGWQVGMNIPLINKARNKAVESAGVNVQIAEANYRNILLQQRSEMAHLLHEQEKYNTLIDYYQSQGQVLAKELLRNAALNYRSGEIDYTTLSQQVEQSIGIELAYLENLYGLSLTVVELKFIAGL